MEANNNNKSAHEQANDYLNSLDKPKVVSMVDYNALERAYLILVSAYRLTGSDIIGGYLRMIADTLDDMDNPYSKSA